MKLDWSKILPLLYQLAMVILAGLGGAHLYQHTQAAISYGADPGTTIGGTSILGAVMALYSALHGLYLVFMSLRAGGGSILSALVNQIADELANRAPKP